VFQEYKLVNGTWDVKSVEGKPERVMPSDIKTTAVMAVEGELDDISGAGQTRVALDMCSGVSDAKKKFFEVEGAGHYGIFSGRRWRDLVYPEVKAFILANNKMPNTVKPAVLETSTATTTKPAAAARKKPANAVSVVPVKPATKAASSTTKTPRSKAATVAKTTATAVTEVAYKPMTKWVTETPARLADKSPPKAAAPKSSSKTAAAKTTKAAPAKTTRAK
jgi:poly(3-hydroxybutyrate) depolymerase